MTETGENDERILGELAVIAPSVVCVLYTTAAVVSQAGWLTLHSNHIIQSLNRHTIGQPGSHDNYDRTPALFLLPVCVCVSAAFLMRLNNLKSLLIQCEEAIIPYSEVNKPFSVLTSVH